LKEGVFFFEGRKEGWAYWRQRGINNASRVTLGQMNLENNLQRGSFEAAAFALNSNQGRIAIIYINFQVIISNQSPCQAFIWPSSPQVKTVLCWRGISYRI